MAVEFAPLRHSREGSLNASNTVAVIVGIASIVGIPIVIAGLSRKIDFDGLAKKFLPKTNLSQGPGQTGH